METELGLIMNVMGTLQKPEATSMKAFITVFGGIDDCKYSISTGIGNGYG